jgi:hypothetical protein
MADKKALDLIEKEPNRLVKQTESDILTQTGLRWDDLIIRFENMLRRGETIESPEKIRRDDDPLESQRLDSHRSTRSGKKLQSRTFFRGEKKSEPQSS